jgi:succinate-semialdehyde dehydrogenase/glutarate-semialdehyde dehydrogenase
MAIETVNPSTGELLAMYEETSPGEVRALLDAVDRAFAAWSQTAIEQRGRLLHRTADVLRARGEHYSALMAREMGKPLAQGKAEVEKCAWVCEYYAKHGADFLADQPVATDATRSYVSFQPLGTVFAVMPWNFPFWQVFRFAAPALMAGNTGVLKHASNVTGCALAIEEVFREAGLPADVFRTLVIGAGRVRSVIEAPQIKAVTLTGSGPAGRAVAAAAGAALKKTVLELGGSDPYVVLEDASLDETVDTCVTSRLINSGQSCIAAKRFIVVASVKEAFERRFVEVMRAKTMGDPFGAVDVGPLARRDLRNELHQQVVGSVERGARLLLGGTADGPGGCATRDAGL